MSMVKDIWFADMERRMAELIDQGMDEDEAYEKAGDLAYKYLGDTMADMADAAKQRAKDEGRWPPKGTK